MALVVVHAFGEGLLCGLQLPGVETYSGQLHVGQHLNQWHLDVAEQVARSCLFQLRLQHVLQAQGDVSVFCCVLVDLLGRQVPHVLLAFAPWPDEFLDVHGLVMEQVLGHVVHVVVLFGL